MGAIRPGNGSSAPTAEQVWEGFGDALEADPTRGPELAAALAEGRIHLPATPLARWKCSDTSGATIANSGSASSGDLTITGSPDVGRPTAMGRAISMTGNASGMPPTEYVSGAASVVPTSPMTILAWANARAFSREYAKIIYRTSRAPWAAPTGHGLRLSGGGETGVGAGSWVAEVSIGGSTVSLVVSEARHRLVLAQWHLVALTHDGTTLRAYLDGFAVGSVSASGSLDNGSTGTRVWMLGSNSDAAVLSECWNGEIREAQVYSSALSAADLRTIYERGVGSAGMP
jgi:hypothetical protein